jgi:hypothetical protein
MGESNSLQFSERIVEREGRPPLMCQPVFIPNGISMSSVASANGVLAPRVRGTLRNMRFVVDRMSDEKMQGLLQVDELAWQEVARARFLYPPMIVTSIGSYDVFEAFRDFPNDDFTIPKHLQIYELSPLIDNTPLADMADEDTGANYFTTIVKPFQLMLRSLRELGYTRLACLSIPPLTISNTEFQGVIRSFNGDVSSPRIRQAFRYKCLIYLNALMAEICAAEGAEYLDTWLALTTDGLATPGVLADGAHYSDEAAALILEQFVVPAAAATLARIQ